MSLSTIQLMILLWHTIWLLGQFWELNHDKMLTRLLERKLKDNSIIIIGILMFWNPYNVFSFTVIKINELPVIKVTVVPSSCHTSLFKVNIFDTIVINNKDLIKSLKLCFRDKTQNLLFHFSFWMKCEKFSM